jgi:hypothetical protein
MSLPTPDHFDITPYDVEAEDDDEDVEDEDEDDPDAA